MSLDLVLLSLVLVFALWGAITGASQQVANVVSLILAWLGARPLGALAGPLIAPQLKVPISIAMIAATIVAFIAIVVLARLLLTKLLQRIFDGDDPESRTVDRTLGFVLGGTKVALIAWVMICALAFVEGNVTFAGKKIGISPKDSKAFAFAAQYNLFELTQFAGAKDLARVASAATDPKQAPKLKDDPAFQKLAKDPRFQKLISEKKLREAFENGDYRALLKDNAVLQLLQDPKFAEQLDAVAAEVP